MNAEEFLKQKQAAKKANRRGGDVEEASLGLTSLMDIVAIIVIYLLKSYASDPITITPLASQKIPMAHADVPMTVGIPIYVSTRDVVFESRKMAALNAEGGFDEKYRSNGGYILSDLFSAMKEESERSKATAKAKQQDWDSTLIIIGDENLKFNALTSIMVTANTAGYEKYNFAIIQN